MKSAPGSSPLTRGKLALAAPPPGVVRLIPAHAGKTTAWSPRWRTRWAHPRSRGENLASAHPCVRRVGSSPLTRGKLGLAVVAIGALGLIPAHAGKTRLHYASRAMYRAHPRSRGENPGFFRRCASGEGSSPLTRGKLQRPRHQYPGRRLIPAHAGKTQSTSTEAALRGAHPRSRGENEYLKRGSFISPGSSPLTRGKPADKVSGGVGDGLIPAHAGKTSRSVSCGESRPAHPRSRGENCLVTVGVTLGGGSSPLTRGKPCSWWFVLTNRGLIPAHAGKTAAGDLVRVIARAHPRSRGENSKLEKSAAPTPGSSPLTRGKPSTAQADWGKWRLIPAHAGKT